MPYLGRQGEFGIRNRFQYLASADDTSVSGSDANGVTMTFSDGLYIDVYLNGVKLKAGEDYNTTTANTVAGISAMSANDEVEIIVYDAFTVADTVSATDGGTFSGNVAMSGTLGVTGNVTMSADASVGDDLTLGSDGAIVNFGDDSDVTLTHVADTGLTVASGTNATTLQVNSNAADAGGAPYIILNRTSDSPADNDNGGLVRWDMENDNNQQFIAASIMTKATDVSDGTEDSTLQLASMVAGTLTNGLIISGGRINSSAYSPAGSIVQAVQNSAVGAANTSSTSAVDIAGYTVNITPASTSNYVIVCFSAHAQYTLVASTNVGYWHKPIGFNHGGGDDLIPAQPWVGSVIGSSGGGEQLQNNYAFIGMDHPNTTDAVTYKMQHYVTSASSTGYCYYGQVVAIEVQV